MRDEAASGTIEEEGGGGSFIPECVTLTPATDSIPLATARSKPPTKQTVKIKVMESVPLSI